MARNDENDHNLNNELSQFNMLLHENVIELWRTEEMCRLKVKSITEIENSLTQVNIENKWLEKYLHDVKLRMEEVRNSIVSYDNINISFYETLTNLEVRYTKKKLEIHKLRNNYELQLFIRTELFQKEEERLNNIPEIKSLKMAESEFKSLKLEYDELLIVRENVLVNIFKAQEENDKQRNAMLVHFANVYLEMQSLNEREACCRTVLRKLDIEYKEKLNMKNSLLISEKKKIKTPTWTNTFYPLDSNIINMKLDSFEQNLKPTFKYSNYNPDFAYQKKMDTENSKSNKTAKKSVNFLLLSDDKISDKNVDTNLLESNLYNITNSSTKNNSIEMNVNADQFSKNIFMQPTQFTIDNNGLMNKSDINIQPNKRKQIEVLTGYKFKKPLNPIENTIQNNTNTKTVHSRENNKNTLQEKGLIEDRDKISPMSVTNHNHEDSCVDKNNDLRGHGSLEFTEHPNLINPTSDSIKMFNNISKYNESSFDKSKTILSGLFLDNSMEPQFNNSGNNSFWSTDISECSDNISQLYSDDMQSSFMNLLNNHPSTSFFNQLKCNELNARGLGDSRNVVFDSLKKKMDTNRKYI